MSETKITPVFVTEHILEVKHAPSGRFLDTRGYVADYIRSADIFQHWEIDTNVINFRDEPLSVKQLGAFAGYRSAGYFVFDPITPNYFEDKACQFWRALIKNGFYTLPEPTRFGCRSKAFINSSKSFEDINALLYGNYFTPKFKEIIGDKQKDLQVVINLSIKGYDMKIVCGPIHKNEAQLFFDFQSDHFSETGVFLDIDVSRSDGLSLTNIPSLLKEAMSITWERIHFISDNIGI